MSKRLLLSSLLLVLPVLAAAQPPPAPTELPGTRNIEVDPIRCWWRTSTGAVRLGEPFDLSLTCAVLESEAVSVVVDESRLGNAVVQMAPFEVISGSHPADLHAGIRRFFQYDYTLRIINPDVIGQDVAIPEVGLHYRVNSRVDSNSAVQGRDLLYFLPPQAVRVLSMVPAGAGDIRDASGASFSGIDDLTFRAGVFDILATALIALGSLMALVVIVRIARGSRKRTPADQRQLASGRLVGVATSELAAVRRERDGAGWTPGLADRAMAATRVAAAAAVGRPINQRTVTGAVDGGEGRLTTRGPTRGTRRVVSAPTTAADLTRIIQRLPESDDRRSTLEDLRDALAAFGGAQYGREAKLDDSKLDDALAAATRAASRVRSEHAFPRTLLRRWSAPQTPLEIRA